MPAAQVARLQENIKAHQQFASLTQQYVEMLSERSRADRLSAVLQVVLELLWNKAHPQFKKQRNRWIKLLLKDGVARIIAQARRAAKDGAQAPALEKALGYFERNQARMQYGTFRKKRFFIGSGVIEAGCRAVVGSRCQHSGMFWSRPGAEKILAFRCIHRSERSSAFWKDRLNH